MGILLAGARTGTQDPSNTEPIVGDNVEKENVLAYNFGNMKDKLKEDSTQNCFLKCTKLYATVEVIFTANF